jgi:hypothetical protein
MRGDVRLLRFFLIEARDWLFAITAFVAVTWTTIVVQDWWVAIGVLVGFLGLYVVAVFASSRLLREGETAD